MTNNRLPADSGPAVATATAPDGQPSLTELVSGIVADAQTLIRQQVEMLRAEIKEDVRRTKDAAKFMGLGIGLASLGGLFLVIGLVYLLQWLAPGLPEWGCWMIVGGVLVAAGLAAVYAGQRKFASFNPLPDKSLNALQENVSWITNPQS